MWDSWNGVIMPFWALPAEPAHCWALQAISRVVLTTGMFVSPFTPKHDTRNYRKLECQRQPEHSKTYYLQRSSCEVNSRLLNR